jgi:hypothetical protein
MQDSPTPSEDMDVLYDEYDNEDQVLQLAGNDVRYMTDLDLIQRIQDAHTAVVGDQAPDALAQTFSAFGLTADNLFHADINGKYKELIVQVWKLQQALIERNLQRREPDGVAANRHCLCLRQYLLTARDVLLGLQKLQHLTAGGAPATTADCADLVELEQPNMEDFERFHLALLSELARHNYRRRDDIVYEEIILPGGIHTHAWREKGQISEVARELCAPEKNHYLFHLANSGKSGNYMKTVIGELEKSQTAFFPVLRLNREVRSFRNGLYDADTDTFIEWRNRHLIPDDVVSCKFYDLDFNHYAHLRNRRDDIMDIPTPAMNIITETQRWDRDVVFMFWAMIGRFIYDQRKYDNWELYMLLIGFGGCGKSSIIECINNLFDTRDVGSLGNKPSDTFGLSHLAKCFIVTAMDINDHFTLDQTTFFSMVSGERVVIEEKYRPFPHILPDFRAPVAMSTNSSLRCFPDLNGNQARRTGRFYLPHRPSPDIPNIKDLLKEQMPAIIVKANRAYRYLADRTKNLAKQQWLPDYFKAGCNLIEVESNPLRYFLETSGVLEYRAELYCPVDAFMNAWKSWLRTFMPQATPDFSDLARTVPFEKKGLTLVRGEERIWPLDFGAPVVSDWVVGCRPIPRANTGGGYRGGGGGGAWGATRMLN